MSTRWIIILILLLGSIVCIPLFLSGFILTHDMYFPLFRLYGIEQCLQEGQIPPRWVSSFALGYGYPFYNFYAPFAYYLAYLFHLVGLGYVHSIHATIICGFLLGGIGTYFWIKEVLQHKLAALVGAIVYIYFPYHLVQVYVRGDISEFMATAFFPWVLFFYHKLSLDRTKYSPWYLSGATVSFGIVILSHNIMALVFTGFLIVYLIFLISFNKSTGLRSTVYGLLALLLGLGLSAYFWLPALMEKQFVSVQSLVAAADYRNHFVSLWDLINPKWGFGGSEPGAENRMSLQLGLAPILLSIISLLLFFYKQKDYLAASERKWYQFTWILLLILIFLMLPISKPVWLIIPMMQYILYPWRLLALAALPLALLSGYYISLIRAKHPTSLKLRWINTSPLLYAIGAIIITIALSSIYLRHRSIPVPEQVITPEFIWNCETAQKSYGTTMKNEYLPQTVSRMPGEFAASPISIIAGNIDIRPLSNSGINRSWNITVNAPGIIRLNTFLFPEWQVTLDGIKYPVESDSGGRLLLAVPIGEHHINQVFENTKVRTISNYITLLSLLSLIVITGFILRAARIAKR
ncbi:MAG: 6-pyruvoyl-tetrahydropterin synthase-related protein [bacterium]